MQVEKQLTGISYWESEVGKVDSATSILVDFWMSGGRTYLGSIIKELLTPLQVIALEGPYICTPQEGGYAWHPIDFYEQLPTQQAQLLQEGVARYAAFLEALKSQYPTAKLGVIGISQGAEVALALCSYHPDLIQLGIAGASRFWAQARPHIIAANALPTLYLKCGLHDDRFLIEIARQLAAWLRSMVYPVELAEYYAGHPVTDEIIADLRQLLNHFS